MHRIATHGASCACCMPAALGRRGLFGLGAAAALTGLIRPVSASEGHYDSMLLTCIDPRMVEPMFEWMEHRGLGGKYSQFAIAGAAIAVVAPPFATWEVAFWDNLATSVKLHHIHRIISLDHRDCGAAKIAYGADRVSTTDGENNLHREVSAKFRAEVAQRFPELEVETNLMALDGSVVSFD